MDEALCDLDAAGLLAAASRAVVARRLADAEDLAVLAQWAALHGEDPTRGPDGARARRVGNVLVHPGGEGTPGIQDFALGEIALARGTGFVATRNALADALDLQHRLPLVWRRCVAGEAEVSVARRVATLSRHLPADRVWLVDQAIARIIDREAAGRVLAVAEAKIIEADPDLHARRVQAERERRYVGFGRTDEFGLRTLIARVEAGDAAAIKATVDRAAQILTPLHPDASADEVRAIALGYLARPAELLILLLEHTDQTVHDPESADLDTPPDPEADPDAGPVLSRALAFPADLLAALRAAGLSALRPKATLYVHLHQAALHGVDAVARVEGLGPATLEALRELLGRTDLAIKPVIDLNGRVRSTAYEHPEALKERVYLTTGGDYWPWAVSTSRHVDFDHPTPYQHTPPGQHDPPGQNGQTDPPGQTGTHNSGPLGRRHHRWKTHAGYVSKQNGAGRYAWLTPHGLGFLVDHTGTRPLPAEKIQIILDAPDGLELYPTA